MSPERSFDLVVVGGGPAGASAARAAAGAGLSVCVLDKRAFPRDKLCGGLVTPRAMKHYAEIFGEHVPVPLRLTSDDVRIYREGRLRAALTGLATFGLVMRRDFDAHMLGLARAAGAEARDGDGLKRLDAAARVVETSSGARLGYRWLAACDGVNSEVARLLRGRAFDPRRIGFTLEIEAPRSDMPAQEDAIEIEFGAAAWGYGWTFPKRDTFTVGVGGVHARNPDMKAAMAAYLRAKGLDPSRYRYKGHFIPFGDVRADPTAPGILFCGDAAGTVDPITGEGIGYAIQSGAAAGRAVAAAVRGGEAAETAYRRAFAPIATMGRHARFWRPVMFSETLRRTVRWALTDRGALGRGYLDIMAGRKDYDALPGLFLSQLAARPWRRSALLNRPSRS